MAPGDAVHLLSKKLIRCSSAKDKKCIGIVISQVSAGITQDSFGDPCESNMTYFIASVGDSRTTINTGAKVCDEGGPVEDGDFLCTSSTPGYLMKQDDDLIHSYTVAQAREDIIFDEDGKATGVYVYLLK